MRKTLLSEKRFKNTYTHYGRFKLADDTYLLLQKGTTNRLTLASSTQKTYKLTAKCQNN